MVDKTSIINDVLAETGNNPVTTSDGSPEWNVASPAYDKAVENTLQARNWLFLKAVVVLNRIENSPDPTYTDAMAMPPNLLHLVWVRLQLGTQQQIPCDYKIMSLGGTTNETPVICLNLRGYTATAMYLVDSQQTGNWPPLFAEVIRFWVRAAIYRGLHEDPAQADKEEQKAMIALQLASVRGDQNNPKRRTFNSRARAARIVRRPWITTPFDWGGTGTPN